MPMSVGWPGGGLRYLSRPVGKTYRIKAGGVMSKQCVLVVLDGLGDRACPEIGRAHV